MINTINTYEILDVLNFNYKLDLYCEFETIDIKNLVHKAKIIDQLCTYYDLRLINEMFPNNDVLQIQYNLNAIINVYNTFGECKAINQYESVFGVIVGYLYLYINSFITIGKDELVNVTLFVLLNLPTELLKEDIVDEITTFQFSSSINLKYETIHEIIKSEYEKISRIRNIKKIIG